MRNAMMKKAETVAAARAAAVILAVSAAAVTFAPAAAYAAEPVTAATATTEAAGTRSKARTVVHLSDLDTAKESVEIPVEIVNNSGKRLVQLFVAPSNASCWGDDLMGQYYMNDGASAWSSITAYGNETVYDIYAVYDDDSYGVFTKFDLSDVPTTGLTLTLDRNSATTSYSTK